MNKFTSYMLGLASGYILSILFKQDTSTSLHYPSCSQIITSETRIDTVMINSPMPAFKNAQQAEKVAIEVAREKIDSVIDSNPTADTVTIALAREQHVYTDDSTYTAWISGIAPQLDSLMIMRSSVTTLVSAPSPQRSRWNISVGAGFAITPRGATPYIGIGVTYNLLTF